MKRVLKILLLATVITMLLPISVLAMNADSVETFDSSHETAAYYGIIKKGVSSDGGSTYVYNDNFTVTFNNADASKQYVLLMVRTEVNPNGELAGTTLPAITADNILYVDQKASGADGKISFDVVPSCVANSVILLGGSFDTGQLISPVILGTMYVSGVELSGTMSYFGNTVPTVTLKPAEGLPISGTASGNSFSFSGVPAGSYTLAIQKAGHLIYSAVVTVTDSGINFGEIALKGGDTDQDAYVNATDLSAVLTDFGSSGVMNNGCDIDEDTYINANDLSIVLSNFGQSAIK